MSSFNKQFQSEVRRLARKEVKSATDQLRKENKDLKDTIRGLRKRLDAVEKANRPGPGRPPKHVAAAAPAEKEPEDRIRVTGKTIRSLRDKLGLTQEELGALVGVSGQSVYQWERRDDRLRLRKNTKRGLLEVKEMGRREAIRRLEELGF